MGPSIVTRPPPDRRRRPGPAIIARGESPLDEKLDFYFAYGSNMSSRRLSERIAGARVFVVPSTSPRNARWSFDEKLDYFRQLRRLVDRERRRG